MNNIEFSENLIKGKIAEIIFEQMFRDQKGYTILRFGYEYTLPEIAQYQKFLGEMGQKAKNNIENSPDFILISEDKKNLYLVEVKYRSELHKEKIKEIAEKTVKRFDPSWLFVASPNGFYLESCNKIIENNGEMWLLSDKENSKYPHIKKDLQKKYLNLLNEFKTKSNANR